MNGLNEWINSKDLQYSMGNYIQYPETINWDLFDKGRYWQYCMFSYLFSCGFPGGSDGKDSAYNARNPGLIPGSGRFPREGNGNPFQYTCLENPMDREGWQATVHGVAKSWTLLERLSTHIFFPQRISFFFQQYMYF